MSAPERDKYDEAIDTLLAAPDFTTAVCCAWDVPSSAPGGCLFAHVTPSADSERSFHDTAGKVVWCGCLTQIRRQERAVAWTKQLTNAIRADERIPASLVSIKPEHLPVFAEWQRLIDKEIRDPLKPVPYEVP